MGKIMSITILILLFSPPVFSQDDLLSLSMGLKSGMLVEKGETSSRTLLFSGVNASIVSHLPSGQLIGGLTYSRGSFLGTTESYSFDISYLAHITENYTPSIGLVCDIESGGYIFFSNGSTYIPPETAVYAGLSIQPFLFTLNNYYISVLDISILHGINIRVPLRSKLGFLNLGIRQGKKVVKANNPMSVEVSTGADFGLAENLWVSFFSAPDARIDIGTSFVGFGLQIQTLQPREELSEFSGYRLLSDVYLSGNFNHWKPSIGIGAFYSAHSFHNDPSYGVYCYIRPLKYHLFPDDTLSITLSFIELKFGSLFPKDLSAFIQSGSFLMQCAPIRIGVSYKI